jgi:hypothetical protein
MKIKSNIEVPINFTGNIEWCDGEKTKGSFCYVFLKNGLYHNENGPAIVYSNGYKEWYLNGTPLIQKR